MKKVTVADAAEHFGVSKEAIHNRIRRGSLETVVENGVKMVLLDSTKKISPTRKVTATAAKNDERYYKLLQEQNEKLQAKVEKLESETRTLRDQKELMLIEERKKIEAIYKEKDEQLKNILSTLSSQFMLTQPQVQEDEAIEVEVSANAQKEDKIISLKKYLKRLNYSEKKMKKMKKVFTTRVKKDKRVTLIDGKIYLDLSKYDYKDLLY